MWAGLINNRQSLYSKAIAAIVICLCGIRAYTHARSLHVRAACERHFSAMDGRRDGHLSGIVETDDRLIMRAN